MNISVVFLQWSMPMTEEKTLDEDDKTKAVIVDSLKRAQTH
ncbi:hypothetical protein [Staphylococcus edaphicus]|nr:hypothetical protein [Staphylococcus edaphicus]